MCRFAIYLEKGYQDIIGICININPNVIGKVLEYSENTGKTIVETDKDSYFKIGWNIFAGREIIKL
jgi:hypothetical protein